MLYQLSYLGAGPLPIAHAIRPIKLTRSVASSSASCVAPGMRYCSVSQRPRSTSAQRSAAERAQCLHRGLAADRTARHGSFAFSHAASQSSTPLPAGWGPSAESRHARRGAQGPPALRRQPPVPPRWRVMHAAPASDAAATPPPAAMRRSAARPAACGPASSSCSGGCTRGRTISARPRAVKPSRRGCSGSSASAACSAGASEAVAGWPQPGKVHQDRARQIAQPDLPRQPRQQREVCHPMRGRLGLPPGRRAT